MRTLVAVVSSALVAAAGIMFAVPAPASAAVSCTGYSVYVGRGGNYLEVPTIGSATRRDNCLLGVGNDSVAVGILQATLNDCYGRHLTVDDDFGSLTRAALDYAQRVEHISVDGVYGPQTRDHLRWYDFSGGCARL